MQKEKHGFLEILPALVAGVLFLTVLVFVVFAVKTYQSAVGSQQRNNEKRALLEYIETAVSSNRASHVTLEGSGALKTLVIRDPETGLKQRIFCRDGQLMETYGMEGSAATESTATVIGETDEFSMSLISPELLEVKTDAGVSYIHIRWQE